MRALLNKSIRTDFNADVVDYSRTFMDCDAVLIFDHINNKAVEYAQSGLTLAQFVDAWKDNLKPGLEWRVPGDPALIYFLRLVHNENAPGASVASVAALAAAAEMEQKPQPFKVIRSID